MKPIELIQPRSRIVTQNLVGLVKVMRPQEWVKNLLVFSGLIFSGSLFDVEKFVASFYGFLIFCCASSAVYVLNDLCDVKEDREHPTKCLRPLAAGTLSFGLAVLSVLVLFTMAILAAIKLNQSFAVIILAYTVTCMVYSFRLKDIVILDVILIASGFVLRAISGAIIIGADVSEWLVLCTSMVALLIGFGKRRHEMTLLENVAGNHRRSLNDYSVEFLDTMMSICAGAAVITYALYTTSDETTARIHSRWMLITIPFVVYGVFRYLYLTQKLSKGGDPVRLLFHDFPTKLNLTLWILTSGLVIYYIPPF